MGKSKELNVAIRNAVCVLYSEGKSERTIVAQLEIRKTTIHNAIVRFQTTGFYESKERSDRLRITTKAEDKHIVLLSKRNRKETVPEICAEIK